MPTEFHQVQSNSHRGRQVEYLERDTQRNSEGDEEETIVSRTTVKAIVIQATDIQASTTVPELNDTMVGELPDNSYILTVEDLNISKEDGFEWDGEVADVHRIIDRQGDQSQNKGKVVIVTR